MAQFSSSQRGDLLTPADPAIDLSTASSMIAKSIGQRFDIFLCYNSKDLAEARQVYEALRQRGLRPWFDQEDLLPGDSIFESLEKAIEVCPSAAVLIGRHGIGPWGRREQRAILERHISRRKRARRGQRHQVIPIFLPGAKRPRLPGFLKEFHQIDFRSGFSTEGIVKLQLAITGEGPRPNISSGTSAQVPKERIRRVPGHKAPPRPKTAVERFQEILTVETKYRNPAELLAQLAAPFPENRDLTLFGGLFHELADVEEPSSAMLWMILEVPGPLFEGPQKEGSLLALPIFSSIALNEVTAKLNRFLKDYSKIVEDGKILPLSRLMSMVRKDSGSSRSPSTYIVAFEPTSGRLRRLRTSKPYQNKRTALIYRTKVNGKRVVRLDLFRQKAIDIDKEFGSQDDPATSFSPLIDELAQYKVGTKSVAYYIGCDLQPVDGRKLYVALSEQAEIARYPFLLSGFGVEFFRQFGDMINRSVLSETYARFIQGSPLKLFPSAPRLLEAAHDPQRVFHKEALPSIDDALLQLDRFSGEPDFDVLRLKFAYSKEARKRLALAKLVALASREKVLALFDLLHYVSARGQNVQISLGPNSLSVLKDPWELLEKLHAHDLLTNKYGFSIESSDGSSRMRDLGEFLEEMDNGRGNGIEHRLHLRTKGSARYIRYILSLRLGPSAHHRKEFPDLVRLLGPTFDFWADKDNGIPPGQTARRAVRALARFFGEGSVVPITLQLTGSYVEDDAASGLKLIFNRSENGHDWEDLNIVAVKTWPLKI